VERTLTCPVCGSKDTNILPLRQYAEFFRLRVDTSKDEFMLFSRTGSISTKPRSLAARALRKIGRILSPPKVAPAVTIQDPYAGLRVVSQHYAMP
jgi:hypothetical protein